MGEADGIREIAVGTVKLIRRSKTREAWRDSKWWLATGYCTYGKAKLTSVSKERTEVTMVRYYE